MQLRKKSLTPYSLRKNYRKFIFQNVTLCVNKELQLPDKKEEVIMNYGSSSS
jgi:hypothetical protein